MGGVGLALASHETGVTDLQRQLRQIVSLVGLGNELNVRWSPGKERHRNGRRLQGELTGSTIHVFVEDPAEAVLVLQHEFFEWVLNIH